MARQRGVAEQVRAGLELQVIQGNKGRILKTPDTLDQKWMGKSLRLHIQEFACLMAVIMCGAAGYVAWHRGSLATVAATVLTSLGLVFLGYRAPVLLHPVWKSWMTFAMTLGAVMTFLMLTIGWVLVLTPFAIAMRLAGKRGMDLSFCPESSNSYWEKRDGRLDDFKLLERQY